MSCLAVVSYAHLPHIVNPVGETYIYVSDRWMTTIWLTSPVVLLHKGVGGDWGEADADEEVDEEVGDEAKVEHGSQWDGEEEIPTEKKQESFKQYFLSILELTLREQNLERTGRQR